jgi:uroporphyrinogen decarboxylase
MRRARKWTPLASTKRSIRWAAKNLPANLPVQGNLDPLLLLAGGAELERQTFRILEAFADRPHVFNLGHGIGQFTPIEHVEHLLTVVRGWRRGITVRRDRAR